MSDTVLVLRTCNPDLTAYNGFQWSASGPVEAPDWDPTPKCGNGLHGLLEGVGNGDLLDWTPEAKWLVVEVLKSDIVFLPFDKIKFPRGNVVHCGDQISATNYLLEHGAQAPIVGALVRTTSCSVTAMNGISITGDKGVAVSAYNGVALAGDDGEAVTDDRGLSRVKKGGTATTGDDGIALAGTDGRATSTRGGYSIAGPRGKAISGPSGVSISDNGGESVSGSYGRSLSFFEGTARTGDYGQAYASARGTAIAGFEGLASAGIYGRAMADIGGQIQITYRDKSHRLRTAIGYIGEDGLEPNTMYQLNAKTNKFIKVCDPQETSTDE